MGYKSLYQLDLIGVCIPGVLNLIRLLDMSIFDLLVKAEMYHMTATLPLEIYSEYLSECVGKTSIETMLAFMRIFSGFFYSP